MANNIQHTNGRHHDQDHSYGYQAEKPGKIPFKGWIGVFKRVIGQLKADHISIVSAGVAFYIFLAIFPALAAFISIYGLVTDPQEVQQQMSQLSSFLPAEAHGFLSSTMENIASKSGQALGWGMALSILLSIWSANKGTKALFQGINIAYNETETRNFLKENGLSLLFTLGGIIAGIISLVLIVGYSALSGNLGLPEVLQTVIGWGRWVILALIVVFAIALCYQFAPVRHRPRFAWVKWGAAIATFLWLVGSWALSFYVTNFGSFDETYGPVAAIVILMLWFFLTSFLILLGAEINSELEHQTRKDTTTGDPEPMGEREAHFADRVATEKRK